MYVKRTYFFFYYLIFVKKAYLKFNYIHLRNYFYFSIMLMKGENNMLNQIVIVGRLVRDPELKESEGGKKYTNITLAVPRSYKNTDGEYEADFIDCRLWTGVAENTAEYCKKGDLLGVKGRVETRNYEKDEEKKYVTEIIAEKVTFLSNKRNEE